MCLDTRVPDEVAVATVRAAAEAIAPSVDGRPGAAELGAHEHVADLIDQAVPGFIDMIVMLLDAYASDVEAGTPFRELPIEGRQQVLRALASEEGQDARDIVDALFVFTLGGVYSEWSGYDRASGELRPPAVWDEVGYHGPVDGHPDYRVGI